MPFICLDIYCDRARDRNKVHVFFFLVFQFEWKRFSIKCFVRQLVLCVCRNMIGSDACSHVVVRFSGIFINSNSEFFILHFQNQIRKTDIESCSENNATMITTSSNTSDSSSNNVATQTIPSVTCGYTNAITMVSMRADKMHECKRWLRMCADEHIML